MAFDGAGVFNRVHDWTTDAGNSINITASRADEEDDGFATGLGMAILKDGQQTLTGNIPFSGMKITGYGTTNAPSARADVPSWGQVQDAGATYIAAGGSAG